MTQLLNRSSDCELKFCVLFLILHTTSLKLTNLKLIRLVVVVLLCFVIPRSYSDAASWQNERIGNTGLATKSNPLRFSFLTSLIFEEKTSNFCQALVFTAGTNSNQKLFEKLIRKGCGRPHPKIRIL